MNKQEEVVLKKRITQLTLAGSFVEAEKVCGYLVSKLPKDGQIHFAFAQILERNSKYQLAVKVYFKTADLDKKLAKKALDAAVSICESQGLVQEGYMVSQALLRLYPKNEKYLQYGGYFSRTLCLDYSASSCYERLLKIRPDSKEYHYYLAMSANHLGENAR